MRAAMTSRSSRDRLIDILRHIAWIRDVEAQLDELPIGAEDEIRTCNLAIMYSLVVIGEAVRQLDDATRASQPHVPWRSIVGMRNMLTHEYYQFDVAIVRAALDVPLSELEAAVLVLLRDVSGA